MAKKLCNVCGKEYAKEMLFGVEMCVKCDSVRRRIFEGDMTAINEMQQEGFFAVATPQAKNFLKIQLSIL